MNHAYNQVNTDFLNALSLNTASGRKLVAIVNMELCDGCGHCIAGCKRNAISMSPTALIDIDKCTGCFVCVTICPKQALRVEYMT